MFNSVFNFYWPTNGGCVGNEWTFNLHLYRCIRARRAGPRSGTTVYNRTGLFINDNINIIIFEMQHKSIRSPQNELSFH